MSDWRETNRAMWDERVPIHVASEYYDVDGFVGGGDTLRDFEPGELGDVDGRTLVHLQCHFGLDTLSWARRGARVTGVDFSAPAIEAAREVAARADLEATFTHADVYDAADALDGERFDIVYTGLGALNWLPDIPRWAQVIADLLTPGGALYLVEFHPFFSVFADDALTVAYPYFHDEPLVFDDDTGTYAQPDAPTQQNRSVEWIHGLGVVITALLDAGLRLRFLHEHDFTVTPHPSLVDDAGRRVYRMPAGEPPLPLMYSLLAEAP